MEIVQEEYQDEWINLEKEKPVYFLLKELLILFYHYAG